MAIRITGMYSGLDTESIITELASAQSAKKNSLVKAQTKLSWKQDAWKALNTKIYSLYTNTLSNLRFQGSYQKKTTSISNANAVSVITSGEAVNGVQAMKITQLAKAGYLTGADITSSDGKKYTKSSKMSDLGITGEGSFTVTVGSKSTNINVDADTTISQVVSQLQSAGVNANFDEKNQRFFVSSKDTGADKNFTLSGNNAGGMEVLSKLGLLTDADLKNDEYKKWASYATDTAAYDTVVAAEVAKRAASYKKQNESLAKTNEEIQSKIDTLKDDPSYTADKTAAELYEELYGPETAKVDEEGNAVTDEQGNPVMERVGGLNKEVEDAKAAVDAAQAALDAAKEAGDETAITDAQTAVDAAQTALTEKEAAFNEVKGKHSIVNAVESYQKSIDDNNAAIADNEKYYTVDSDNNVTGTSDLETQVRTEFDAKVATAVDVMNGSGYKACVGATKVTGQDAIISLNDAEFTSNTNTFEINGLTITALTETTETITLTTGEDTDGIYDMIKNFFTEYNKLINEMDSLYNADSAKGYDPLLSEEKSAMSDSEIEEWENKVKGALLRRDQTLDSVASAMKNVLLKGATVNGKTMYLSDFGINTLGYFSAADNEKNAYHIDGDEDDANVKDKDNTLKSMIASDPDTVISFFSELSKNLYTELTNQMATSSMSSAFTVYNDKEMKEEYDNYTEKISKQEEKINDLMDKWYSKFSSMEVALSKLESKNSAISGMLGG